MVALLTVQLLQEPFKLSALLTTENSTYETKVKYLLYTGD